MNYPAARPQGKRFAIYKNWNYETNFYKKQKSAVVAFIKAQNLSSSINRTTSAVISAISATPSP
jgi:hypothetical protein